jgi:signal recognition particle GTPase
MTNYYQQEDDPVETPDVTQENIDAVERGLAHITEQVAEQVNRSGQVTEWLYGRQQTAEDMALVAEQHATIDALAVRITQVDIAFRMSAAFSKKINETYRKLAADYDDLEEALICGDDSHPLTSEFADNIREQSFEDMSEIAYDEASKAAREMAYYNLITELQERIRELSDSRDYPAIFRFAELLLNDEVATERQRELLSQLVETFNELAQEAVQS